MTQIGFFINQSRCIGCHTCSVSCKDWYDIDAGSINWMRIKKIEKGIFPNPFLAYLPSPCYHCENPDCLKVCPTSAIVKRDSDGIILVDQEKCIGKTECGMLCLKACPWNSPQFGSEDNAKMQKCNLCYERLDNGQQAICVEACPMYALDVGPIDKLKEKHGNNVEAVGFSYSDKVKPSVILKKK
jgi:anaerobic dimethyl sulfoxide reductase subunit B (iron-sulfur subunit)